MAKLLLTLYFKALQLLGRTILFILIAPFSKSYRRREVEYFRPIVKVFREMALWGFLFFLLYCIDAEAQVSHYALIYKIYLLGWFGVVGIILVKKIRRRIIKKQFLTSQKGFTFVELLCSVAISFIVIGGTIGFVKQTNAVKTRDRIVNEFDNVYSACVKMAKEKTSFTMDDLVQRGYLPSNVSFCGGTFSVNANGKTVNIRLTLPTNISVVRDFPPPLQYTGNSISASYVLPRSERAVADKNWYGF